MINIDIEKYIKDRVWLGWYWTGTIFPWSEMSPPYWCKLASPEYEWAFAMDVRGFKNWG